MTLSSSAMYVLAGFLMLCGAYLLIMGQPVSVKAKAGELPATVATTSNPTVGTTPLLLFATSTCGVRIISTTASPIMLTFSDVQGSIPTATFGTLQAASTTVVYDNGQYGCGAYRAYAFVSGAITIMESK